nr:MAG TPA: putative transcriptional regulator [Caudoviricetes sp.]
MSKQLELFDEHNNPQILTSSEFFPDVESEEIEFKSADGGFPKDFWKTYSAFANTNGGTIILGVKEKKGDFIFDGLTDKQVDNYKKEFWNNVNNPNTVSKNLLNNDDVRDFIYENKRILCFHIHPADRKQKPVYLTLNPFKNTYKRNYEGDYVCSDEEVRRMMADADLSHSPDSRILENFTIEDDIDISSLQQYRQIFSSFRIGHPWSGLNDKEFLEQLGGYRKDRKTKREGLTVAGLLMFGKYKSITDEECCPNFFPDYQEKTSNELRWENRISPDGTWECNLFQFYRKIYPLLSSRLPKPFKLVEGQRVEDTEAHVSLREAFINTLVHCDYTAEGNITIENSIESFRFTNPGTLLVTITQFYKGGVSQCRNKSLQKMFLMIGSAEKAGSGVGKIISGWNSLLYRKPYISIDTQPDRVRLEMPMFSTIPDTILIELKELYGDNVEGLGKDELTALAICCIEGEVTNTRLQYVVDLHRSDITKMLQDLCRDGYLISGNKGRWTTYHLNRDYKENEGSLNEGSLNEGSLNEGSLNEGSLNDGSLRRISYDRLSELIMKFCQSEYKSALEIANQFGRTEKHIKERIITKMIQEGKLLKLHQDNHPGQKYKSK